MQAQLRVGIIGASGYGGAELARLLAGHSHAAITAAAASGERIGQSVGELFPSLRGICEVACEEFSPNTFAEKCDLVFVALGHGHALNMVPQLLDRGLRIIDIGADFRLRDPAAYQQWYKLDHSAPAALAQAVYGLPEWQRTAIAGTQLVANPGCYPTAAILALAPFVAAGAIATEGVIIDAASGTSGAGRSSFGPGMHFPEVYGDYKAYSATTHRHTPEIEQGLADAALQGDKQGAIGVEAAAQRVTFTPHLLPIARGILCTCYATPKQALSTEQAHAVLQQRYADEPFVRVLPAGQLPQVKHVCGSNYCDIGVVVDGRTNRLIVVAAIDNLVKGAAGQAVQNMNLMYDWPETEGLQAAPIFP